MYCLSYSRCLGSPGTNQWTGKLLRRWSKKVSDPISLQAHSHFLFSCSRREWVFFGARQQTRWRGQPPHPHSLQQWQGLQHQHQAETWWQGKEKKQDAFCYDSIFFGNQHMFQVALGKEKPDELGYTSVVAMVAHHKVQKYFNNGCPLWSLPTIGCPDYFKNTASWSIW